jgi:DNA-binding XRE family transcriptional regulator
MTPGQFRTARQAKGMTQAKTAAYLGTARNTVSRYERGERAIPPLVAIRMAGPPDEMVEAVERCVIVCPQCEGEGGYPDGLDEAACHTECTRCGSNGWIVSRAAITATLDYMAMLDTGELPARYLERD